MSKYLIESVTKVSIAVLLAAGCTQAETVELVNGDVIHGKVLSLDANTLKLQSESFGELTIQRERIGSIYLVARKPPTVKPTADDGQHSNLGLVATPDAVLNQLQADGAISAKDMQAVQQKMPLLAVPEVKNYVSERLVGLISGKLNVMDIRKEAIGAVDQIKDIQKDLGPQAGALNGYLSILENFIQETEPKADVPKKNEKPDTNKD